MAVGAVRLPLLSLLSLLLPLPTVAATATDDDDDSAATHLQEEVLRQVVAVEHVALAVQRRRRLHDARPDEAQLLLRDRGALIDQLGELTHRLSLGERVAWRRYGFV